MMIEIRRATANDGPLLGQLPQLRRLLAQLAPQKAAQRPLTRGRLKEVLAQSGQHLLVAWDGNEVAGITMLVIKLLLLETKADVEEVVVDEARYRQGISTALMDATEALAGDEGVDTIYLTSNPAREAANRLYQERGYEQYRTNLYRLQLT
jgi:GNAT superfamily N-acetyltransferase